MSRWPADVDELVLTRDLALAEKMGKTTVVSRDIPGFIVRVLRFCIPAGLVTWKGKLEGNTITGQMHVSDDDGSNRRWIDQTWMRC